MYAAGVMLFEMLTGTAAAYRRVAARGRLQARQRRRPAAVEPGARPAAGGGRPGRAGHQPRPRPAAVGRRPVPAGRHRGPARRRRCPRSAAASTPRRTRARAGAAATARPGTAAPTTTAGRHRPRARRVRPGPRRPGSAARTRASPGLSDPATRRIRGLGGAGLGGLGLGGMAGDRAASRLTSQPIGRHQAFGGSSGEPHHTLVVSAGTLVPGFGDGDDDYQPPRQAARRRPGATREPPLQRLLFSRRLFYVLGALAVVLGAVLIAWWLTAGQYTKVPRIGHMPAALGHHRAARASTSRCATGPAAQRHPARACRRAPAPRAGARIRSGGTVTLAPVARAGQGRRAAGDRAAAGRGPVAAAGPRADARRKPKETTSTTIPAGVVISTSPVAGTAWPKDRPVGISVSAGPPLPELRRPAGRRGAGRPRRRAATRINPVR